LPTAPAKWPVLISAAILLLLPPSIRDGEQWGYSPAEAQPLPQTAQSGERLLVERIGGHDRAGLPGSRVESRGELELSRLSPTDRQTLEGLFNNPDEIKPPPGAADFESYRMTRQTAAGTKTITVPFNAVPDVVRKSVTDTLK
jgi:hypothetical protein